VIHERTLQRILTHSYFRHKREEQRAPGTTVLSEDAMMMFSEDGMTVNLVAVRYAVSFSRFQCCGFRG